MKGVRWAVAAIVALLIMTMVVVTTEAHLSIERNIAPIIIGFVIFMLIIRVIVATLPYVKQQIRGEGAFAQKPPAPETLTQAPVIKCPKCGSTSLSGDKKGFGVGKAVIGAALIGPLGLTAGNMGSKKVRVTCLNCGHQWMAGKAR